LTIQGKSVFINQKEVLDALAKHKEEVRFVPKHIDQGEPKSIEHLSTASLLGLKVRRLRKKFRKMELVKQKMGKHLLIY
jgi:hypothetical protein